MTCQRAMRASASGSRLSSIAVTPAQIPGAAGDGLARELVALSTGWWRPRRCGLKWRIHGAALPRAVEADTLAADHAPR